MLEPNHILNEILANPMDWFECFENPLTAGEERLLTDLDQQIHTTVLEAIPVHTVQTPVVYVSPSTKTWIMDLLTIQKRIRMLIEIRGKFRFGVVSEN